MLADAYDLVGAAGLRRLDQDLADAFASAFLATEADLRQWMPSAVTEQEDARGFIDRCSTAFEVGAAFAYAIVDRVGGVIGYLSLRPDQGHAVVGYWVRPDWRGRGIAPLALAVLTDAAFVALEGVEAIHAHLDAANAASRRVLEKAGFRHRETYARPPRTRSESDTEWLYVRDRCP